MKTSILKNKKLMAFFAVTVALIMLLLPLAALAQIENGGEPTYTEIWDGLGKNSIDCSKAGEGGRPDNGEGWIYWIFSTKGNSTNAVLTLSGSGSGTYQPVEPLNAEVWHFITPYFDVYELTASIELFGGEKGPGGGLVISDYCPGTEVVNPMLTIEKELLDVEGEEVLNSTLSLNLLSAVVYLVKAEKPSLSVLIIPKNLAPVMAWSSKLNTQ